MGWPFETPGWENVIAEKSAYYVGLGSEQMWLWVSVAICVIAVLAGGKHEADAYRQNDLE